MAKKKTKAKTKPVTRTAKKKTGKSARVAAKRHVPAKKTKIEPVRVIEPVAPTRLMTRRQRAVEEAERLHKEWLIDFGSGGDIISDLGYRSHVMQILRLLGQDENLAIEATQIRKQCGLEPLDVLKLAFKGELKARVERSRDEVAEISIQNALDAEKKALKKKQRNRLGA